MGPSDFSTVLFAMPSFLSGAASVLDMGGTLTAYNDSPDPETADSLAIFSDWCAIGEDMERALQSGDPKPQIKAA